MVVGGSLFAFSTFIMAALKRVPAAEGARVMQQINITVFTPWFMGPFLGMAVFSVVMGIVAVLNTDQPWWLPLLGAGAFYAIGVFVVTAAGNVPLNNRLAGMDADDAATAAFWERYQRTWTRLNHARVVASIGSVVLFAEALRLAA